MLAAEHGDECVIAVLQPGRDRSVHVPAEAHRGIDRVIDLDGAASRVFRCLFVYVLTWGMLGGALMAVRCMSRAHPARTAYATTIEALKGKVDTMPWRGIKPSPTAQPQRLRG